MRAGVWVMLALALALAACGGSDGTREGSSVPVVARAEKVGEAELDDAWYDAFGFATSDALGTVYRTSASLPEVTAYYSDGITAEGWTVVASAPMAMAQTVMASKDDRVAMLTLMSGETYTTAPGLGGLEDMGITIDNVADDETIVTVQEFTCDEDDVGRCTFLQ